MPLCRVCLKDIPVCLSLNEPGGCHFGEIIKELVTGKKFQQQNVIRIDARFWNICYRCYCDIKFAHSIQQKIIKAEQLLAQKLEVAEKLKTEFENPDVEMNPIKDIELSFDLNEFECKICGEDYDDYQELLKHTAEHFKGPQVCLRHNRVHFSMASYRLHMTKKHPRNEKFQCSFCQMTFRYHTLLLVHQDSVHIWKTYEHEPTSIDLTQPAVVSGEKMTHFMCEICGKLLMKKYQYLHMKNHSNKSTKCEYCGNHYANISSLERHQNVRHFKTAKIIKKKLICPTCGKICLGANALRIHERQHTNDKPYKCELCGEAFKQNVLLRRHNKVKHLIMEPETEKCLTCFKKFRNKQALAGHMGRAHFVGASATK